MREDRVHQLFLGGFEIHRDHIALDQFGHFGADHVGAKQLAGFLVEDNLHQTLILAQGNGLAVADEGKTADANVELLLLGSLRCQADRGDLGRAIGAARNHQFVHRMRVQAFDRLDANDAFVLGLMRQHWGTRDVAYCIDAGHAYLVVLVDDDGAAVGLHAELFEPEILDIADHSDRGDHALNGDGLYFSTLLHRRNDAVAFLVQLRDLCVGVDFDSLLLETLACKGLDLMILDRQNLRQHFNHRDLGPERAEERSEFDADRAGADHQQRLGHPIRHHGLEIGPHKLLVGLKPRQHARARSCGTSDVLGLLAAGSQCAFRRFALRSLDRDLAWRIDRSFAPDHRDLVFLHQESDAIVEAFGYRARPRYHAFGVVADIVGLQAIIFCVLEIVEDLRGAKQSLGGDAAPIETDTAKVLALDNRCL